MRVSLLMASGGLLAGAVTLTAMIVLSDRLPSAGPENAPDQEAVSSSVLHDADGFHLTCSSPCDWAAIFLGQHR